MKSIDKITLTWRKGRGGRRISVGILKTNASKGCTFEYIKDGVAEAQKDGYSLHESFPVEDKIYSENVLSIFGQRLMRSDRNDISDFYQFWLIDQTQKENTFYMLAYTQGMLPTDNYEFLANFNSSKTLSFITEIAGLSKSEIASDVLEKDQELDYELEPINEFDNKAVKLSTKNGIELGYIKKVHNSVFHQSKRTFKLTVHHLERNGILKRVFIKVQ